MTRAPMRLPICTAESPTPPAAPSTSSVSPARSCARSRSACSVVPYAVERQAAVAKSTPSGHRHGLRRVGDELLGDAAGAADGHDAIADPHVGDAGPDGFDDAGHLAARRERRRRLELVLALHDEQVRES